MSDTPEVVDRREHQERTAPVDDRPGDLDLQLRSVADGDARTATTSRRPDAAAAIMVLALGAMGFGVWWWAQRARVDSPVRPPASATEAETVPAAAVPLAPPLPPLDAMDPFVRTLLASVSSSPELLRWLATDDLIRQMVLAIDRVASGALPPRNVLGPFRPTRDFVVSGRAGAQRIDAASYRRFDGLVAAVANLDAGKVATAYATIRPRLDEAYRAMGRGPGIDGAVAAALQALIDAPSLSPLATVKPGTGVGYAYVDPTLEALPPAQKLVLRLGPAHADTVKAKLSEIKQAIDASTPR